MPVRAEGRIATVAGALLAAGAWRDAGRAAVALRAARLLSRLFEEVLLVGGTPPPTAPGRRVPAGSGPPSALRDLLAALEATSAEQVLVVSGDLERVSPDLLLALVAWPEADAVAARSRSGSPPVCALYRRRAVLPALRARHAAGERDIRALLAAVPTRTVEGEELAGLTRLPPS